VPSQRKTSLFGYRASVEEVRHDVNAAMLLVREWVTAFLTTREDPAEKDYADEVAVILLTDSFDVARVVDASVLRDLPGMAGSHPLIENGTYRLNFNQFMSSSSSPGGCRPTKPNAGRTSAGPTAATCDSAGSATTTRSAWWSPSWAV